MLSLNILILKNETIINFHSLMDDLYERYPSISRVYLGKDNFKDVCKTITAPPILTKNWLIVTNAKVPSNNLLQLMNTQNIVCIIARNKDDVTNIANIAKQNDIDLHYVDESKPKRNDVLTFIRTNLKITIKDATYLYNRTGGYLPLIAESVALLQGFNPVTRENIKEYTVRSVNNSFYIIIESLLGLNPKARPKAIAILHKYRYGFKYILNYVKKELGKYNLIFQAISRGDLGYDNYRKYSTILTNYTTDKISLSEYQVKKILDAYSIVSQDFLTLILAEVNAIPAKNFAVFHLINLLI